MKYITLLVSLFLSTHIFSQNLQATEQLALVNVSITNFKNEPSSGDIIKFKSKTTNQEFIGKSNEDGRFQILLPKETFVVFIQGFESDQSDNELKIPNIQGLINFTYTIRYELPKVYTLENVNFDVNKTTIRPESFKTLDELVELMKRKKTLEIELSGHTDDVGDDSTNLVLSKGRANSVKDYLIRKGISYTRVAAVGYGETKPIATNDTEEGRKLNRRTEVSIIKE